MLIVGHHFGLFWFAKLLTNFSGHWVTAIFEPLLAAGFSFVFVAAGNSGGEDSGCGCSGTRSQQVLKS